MEEEPGYSVIVGSQGYQDFQRAMEDYVYIDGERQPEPRRITPRSIEGSVAFEIDGNTHWYSQEEERTLRNYISQQRTAARLDTEQGLGRGILEQMRPLQDTRDISDMEIASQLAMATRAKRFSERMGREEKETQSKDFLANIEK